MPRRLWQRPDTVRCRRDGLAFHLEDDAIAIIDVDHAGVLAGALDDARSLGAVLVPHGREDAKLGKGRLAADQIQNALIFIRLQAVGGNQFGGDLDRIGNGHGRSRVLAWKGLKAGQGIEVSLAQVNLSCDRKSPAFTTRRHS
ncbi:hypothetical protein DdX_22182 [Ditylenchus destructor]|uniref:Uncharacterized protein n=1 Tax=Ditylenchus destructor TaxID=166010 RepID=A0AAD4MIB7_9BILA|nr:hypothetical protein DdX_22182 [Ditylenchus destructor]